MAMLEQWGNDWTEASGLLGQHRHSPDCSNIMQLHELWPAVQESLSDHTHALDYVLDYLKQQYSNTIKDEVAALGHRVVHGMHLSEPVLVDDKVMQIIKEAADLAPLHNPANLQGIVAASAVFTGSPQVLTSCKLRALKGWKGVDELHLNIECRRLSHRWQVSSVPSRSLSLTQPSIRQCRLRPTCMPCHMSTTQSTMCASMASTARPSNTL